MTNMERKTFCAALSRYGAQAQITMAFEEMAELQDVLCKFLCGRVDSDTLRSASRLGYDGQNSGSKSQRDAQAGLRRCDLFYTRKEAIKMKTMLDIMRERLIEGVQITKAKELPSKFQIVLSKDGFNYDTALPKQCSPGMEESFVDRTIYSALAFFALQQNDLAKGRYWLDRCQRRHEWKDDDE